jgi:hypothetical protein
LWPIHRGSQKKSFRQQYLRATQILTSAAQSRAASGRSGITSRADRPTLEHDYTQALPIIIFSPGPCLFCIAHFKIDPKARQKQKMALNIEQKYHARVDWESLLPCRVTQRQRDASSP